MALRSADVRVAITGELHVAPTGTEGPETATDTLDSGWVGLGYVSADGVTETYDESQENISAWQNGDIVRKITTESEAKFQLTLIQSSKDTLELYHKSSVVVSDGNDGYKINVLSPSPDVRSFVFDVIDGDEHIRMYIPRGEVSERGDISYVSGDAVGYDITITAYPVDLGDGDVGPLTKFSNSPSWAPDPLD